MAEPGIQFISESLRASRKDAMENRKNKKNTPLEKEEDSYKAFRKSEKAFTLIELIVILAILGILSAVMVPNINRFLGRGTAEASATELRAVQQSIDLYMADNNLSVIPAQGTAIRNLSASTPPLYPDYARFATVGRTGGYTWVTTGIVTAAGNW